MLRETRAAHDVLACRRLLARGSKSFAAASRLLPKRVREPAAVVYAFCRVADDAIDDEPEPVRAHARLQRMLDRVWAAQPVGEPIERALARVVEGFALPRAPFDALLEGFAWDAAGRELVELDDVRAYGVRVASSVGVIMTMLMGARDHVTLARACDLGIAMQLTNIARDVGEDARRGRVYLPTRWLEQAGIDRAQLLRTPSFSPELGAVVERLLVAADDSYRRADPGIELLPADCRAAIRAARSIYSDIGRVIRERGCDSVGTRAHTTALRKLVLLYGARRASPAVDRDDTPVSPVARALVEASALP